MREILFRGKTILGDWVSGYLSIPTEKLKGYGSVEAGHAYISNQAGCPFAYDVRPETVGQYTGRDGVDSEGKKVKIFENHFVKCDDGFVRVVEWVQEESCFKLRCPNSWAGNKYIYFDPLYLNESEELIMVGNVFDDNFDEHNIKLLHKPIEESGY